FSRLTTANQRRSFLVAFASFSISIVLFIANSFLTFDNFNLSRFHEDIYPFFAFKFRSLERSSHEFGYESKMRSVVCKPSRYVSRGRGANHISLCQNERSRGDHHVEGTRE